MPSTRRTRTLLATIACVLWAAIAHAQVTLDPRTVEFDPSPDHNSPTLVVRYDLEVYLAGGTTPIRTVSLGKPAPQGDGKIRVDLATVLGTFLASGTNYESRVTAVSDQSATGRSTQSNQYAFTASCAATISPTSSSIAGGPGTGTFNVNAAAGCAWTAASMASWITITGGAAGTGNGTVTYSVTANPTTTPRSGQIAAGGQTFTLNQAGACTFNISPTSASWSASAATGNVAITTTAGCAWSASSPVSWITFSGPTTGSGNGSVNYSVAANTSTSARNATLSIAGRAFTVNQAGVVCTPTLSASGVTVASGGGPGSVSVSVAGGCTWTASSGVSWITISGGSPGNGNGTVTYNVAPNGSSTSRSGNLTIAGQTYAVTQEGVTCSFTVSPTSSNVPSTSSTGTASVSAPGGCAWTAVSNASWIGVTSASGSGNGSFGYSVAANTTVSARSGSITIGGQTFTINQAAAPCTFSISPTSASAPAGASSSSIAVTVATGCNWTAVSNASWISIPTGGSGNGNGTVNYNVAANPGTAGRSGTITVAGQTFTVNQAGVPCNFSISPTGASVAPGSGTGTIAVTSQTGCSWTATSNTSWITVTSGTPGSGNGTVGYSFAANSSTLSRSGSITVAGQTFTVTQSGIPCTFSISPTGASVAAGATSGNTVGVTAPAGCTWNASSGASWLTITGGASGSGNGNVTYNVAANGTTSPRTGTLTIAGHSFSVTQAGGSCNYSVSPTSATIPAAGESRTVNVTVQAGCAWTPTPSASWVTITSGSGPGSGTINYTVAANTSTASRSATIAVGSQIFNITQQGVPCSYSLTPASISVGATATTGTVTVTAQAGCAWTATTTASWISVTGGASGSGNGTVSYSITANPGTSPRINSITIAGQTFTVTQAGVPCTFAISPTGASVAAGATTGTVTVTAAAGCTWSASSSASWISITSGASGNGNGTVGYSIAANPGTTSRTGTATIAGQTFSVTQAGVVCTFSVSPTDVALSWASASLPIDVTTGGSCAWSASSGVSWITLASGGGPGSGSATFNVASNTTSGLRSGTLTVAGQTINVTQASGSCTYTISPSLVNVGADATTIPVTVTTQGGCPWSSSSPVSWASFPSGGSGSGPGTVQVAVGSNPDSLGRLATLQVGGRSLVLNQAGRQCSYSLAPTDVSVGAQGTSGSFAVTASNGCSWTASTSASWVSASGSGTGDGSVTYSVAANTTGSSRSATITVANRSFTITQAGDCSYSISPTDVAVGEEATSGTAFVTAGPGCPWNASSQASWLSITSGSSGSGNGVVNYNVAANPGGQTRTGTLNIAGDVFTVVQSSCGIAVTPPTVTAPSSGFTTYALVRAGQSCSWNASTSTSWISFPEGTAGSGTNWVTFVIASNPGSSTRTGSVNVSGQVVSVIQNGACTISVGPTTVAAPTAGGVQSVNVTTGASCGWSVSSQAGWITINSGSTSGSGNASVSFTVAANPGAARSGTIRVSGITVTINQAGGPQLTTPKGLRVIP